MKLEQIESAMRPQFIWHKEGLKPLQVIEDVEGSLDLARMIFCGIADMYGNKDSDIREYLNMEYDSYRYKISKFRELWKEGNSRLRAGELFKINDPIRKFYIKTTLVLNAIKFITPQDPFLKISDYITYE